MRVGEWCGRPVQKPTGQRRAPCLWPSAPAMCQNMSGGSARKVSSSTVVPRAENSACVSPAPCGPNTTWQAVGMGSGWGWEALCLLPPAAQAAAAAFE